MNTERTPEQKREVTQEIYDGLEEGKYEDRSRFSLQVENPIRFLENYARIGLIKERLEKVLSSDEVTITREETVKRGELVKLPGNKEFHTTGKMKYVLGQLVKASKENTIEHSKLVSGVYGEDIAAGKITEQQAKDGIDRIMTRLRFRLQKEVQLTITNTVSAKDRFEGKSAAYYLAEFSRPSVLTLPIEPIKSTLSESSGSTRGTVIEYQIPESDRRTVEETRVLKAVVWGLSRHTRLYYDQLQVELNDVQTPDQKPVIYSARDIKIKFDSAYRKMTKEFQIPLRHQIWTEDDKAIWDKTQKMIDDLYESDSEKFLRSIRAHIETAERAFKRL